MNADSNSLESLDIRKVAESLGLKVRQRGAKAFIYCPACEPDGDAKPPHHCELGGKKPHLWRCHKCGESGDAVGLVKVVRGCDAAGAFAWLRERSFLRNTRPPQPAQHHKNCPRGAAGPKRRSRHWELPQVNLAAAARAR